MTQPLLLPPVPLAPRKVVSLATRGGKTNILKITRQASLALPQDLLLRSLARAGLSERNLLKLLRAPSH